MVVAKRTSKNQLPLPEAVIEQAGLADDDDATCHSGPIVLTPLHPGGPMPFETVWVSSGSANLMWPMP